MEGCHAMGCKVGGAKYPQLLLMHGLNNKWDIPSPLDHNKIPCKVNFMCGCLALH